MHSERTRKRERGKEKSEWAKPISQGSYTGATGATAFTSLFAHIHLNHQSVVSVGSIEHGLWAKGCGKPTIWRWLTGRASKRTADKVDAAIRKSNSSKTSSIFFGAKKERIGLTTFNCELDNGDDRAGTGLRRRKRGLKSVGKKLNKKQIRANANEPTQTIDRKSCETTIKSANRPSASPNAFFTIKMKALAVRGYCRIMQRMQLKLN